MDAAILNELKKPFHPSHVSWKPGAVKGDRALALAYADLRAYMNRLDEVCGSEWAVVYEPWGNDRIICRLTIMGITRSSTGETTNEAEKSEIGGTVAEAQAFKRAAAMFGVGRYLYNLPTGWADFDPAKRHFTDRAKAKLTGILVEHYRRATEAKSAGAELFTSTEGNNEEEYGTPLDRLNELGEEYYGNQWEQVLKRNARRISGGETDDAGKLPADKIEKLITGLAALRDKRESEINGAPA